MKMQQLIYASRPIGYNSSTLAAILLIARLRNEQSDITGALICRSDIYLQLLEGPVDQVEAVFGSILRDERHFDIRVLVKCRVVDRLFPDWTMKQDPAQSWLWSREEVSQGVPIRASARDIRSVFVRVANQPAL